MSELIEMTSHRRGIRWQLLATASALTLMGSTYSVAANASESDGDRPTVWIELGGQFEKVDAEQSVFIPPFFAPQPSFTSITPGSAQKPLDYSYGAEGSISFQPVGTDWLFSAAVRYGRSNGNKHNHQSTSPVPVPATVGGAVVKYITPAYARFADAKSRRSENHLILDFQAGKDVGLGIFGKDNHSVVGLGVRFAQFHTETQVTLGLGPSPIYDKYFHTSSGTSVSIPINRVHTYSAAIRGNRSFHGLGPSVYWDSSEPFAGNPDKAEFTFDWGINAAVLFGRQKASVHHQATAFYFNRTQNPSIAQTLYQHSTDHTRAQSVTVPNLGGFAGLSLKFPNAKISLGYRADFFFGAMDGGVDTAKRTTLGFNGPYASISIGLP